MKENDFCSNEERVFFRKNYPDVYKKYIEKPDNQNFTR